MSLPYEDFFFPVSFTALARGSQVPIRGRIVGVGEMNVGNTKKSFFIVLLPVGNGKRFKVPVFETEMIKGDKVKIEKDRQGTKVTIFLKKPKKGLSLCFVKWPDGEPFPCRKYAVYRRVKQKWIPVEADGIDLLK